MTGGSVGGWESEVHTTNPIDMFFKNYMGPLDSLNPGEEDHVTFAATLLHIYHSESPWVLSEKTLAHWRELLLKEVHGGNSMADEPGYRRRNPYPLPDETMKNYLRDQMKCCKEISPALTLFDPTELRHENDDTVSSQTLDLLLGIAGFRPDKLLLDPEKSRVDVIQSLKQHIQVTEYPCGYEVDVHLCIEPWAALPATSDQGFINAISAVIALFNRIEMSIRKLQSSGELGNELVYFCRRDMPRLSLPTTASSKAAASNSLVEARSIHVHEILLLSENIRNLKKLFQQEQRAWSWSSAVGKIIDHAAFVLTAPISVLPFLATSAGINWWKSAHIPGLTVTNFTDGVSTLAQKLRDQLHAVALTGQTLSLIIQGQLRGWEAPFELDEFIDRPISSFHLRGVHGQGVSVHALAQCTAVSPERQFVVFQTEQTHIQDAENLCLTPSLALQLWKAPFLLQTNEDIQGIVSTSCISICMGDGQLSQQYKGHESDDSVPWQWQSLAESTILSGTNSDKQQPVLGAGLHERIIVVPNDEKYNSGEVPETEYIELTAPTPGTSNTIQQTHADAERMQLPVISTTISENSNTSFTSATMASGSGSGDRRDANDATNQEGVNPPAGGCVWEHPKAVDEMKDRLGKNYVTDWRTLGGSMKLESFNFAVIARGLLLDSQLSATYKRGKSIPHRQQDTRRTEIIYQLENNSCVLLSLHTGVLRRVRLRKAVAYFADKGYVHGKMTTDEKDEIVSFLHSNKPVAEWKNQTKKEIVDKLDNITALVFWGLGSSSGVRWRKGMYFHWPGPVFYVAIRKSSLPGWIKKYFANYHVLDETPNSGDNSVCVVGSGDDFERAMKWTKFCEAAHFLAMMTDAILLSVALPDFIQQIATDSGRS
ncbi:hypothetical protein LMH87_003021 [Akanthomyces muscarius]|uniref:Uncharacterized protein n=1 Tax=Akanthomyces muscarius TaxID=2231603 RepID=A0A9W8QA15_AKAMU|nr:hypothetical protein LMH87_003021 [Akanthomyces muscarius]KAJ4148556.1 hypothetical protein LMH87_003021 [Akanthomyces muscarius]